jgi:hypothetical protein
MKIQAQSKCFTKPTVLLQLVDEKWDVACGRNIEKWFEHVLIFLR